MTHGSGRLMLSHMSVRHPKPSTTRSAAVSASYARYPYHLLWRGELVAAFGSRTLLPEPLVAPVFTLVDGISHDVDFVRWVGRSLPGKRARDFTLYAMDGDVKPACCYEIDAGWVAVTHQWHPARRAGYAAYYHLLTLHYDQYSRRIEVRKPPSHSVHRVARNPSLQR